MNNNVIVGSSVRFYDSQKANKDKDYSGTNSKYFPIGEVIAIYKYKSIIYDYIHDVCDIKINNRISKAHFIECVQLIS